MSTASRTRPCGHASLKWYTEEFFFGVDPRLPNGTSSGLNYYLIKNKDLSVNRNNKQSQ